MDLTSLCPFPVAAFPWQAQPGEWNLSVCVKATFSLVHGQEAPLCAAQNAIVDDAYWDNNPSASLYAPSDFVPYKPRVDVLLTGHAYAPGGAPVDALTVRLTVGSLVKTLRLTGDRAWVQGPSGLQPGPPALFRRMALRYERAALAGENPIGIAGAAQGGVEVGRPLPSVVASGTQTPGFGPLPLLWRARRRQLPDAAVLWAYRVRLASGTMPQGLDFDFFNSAPAEQQVSVLPPRAAIVLENLNPHLPRLESRLPTLAPKLFRVDRSTGRPTPVVLRADTLWIDTDRALAVVSWRGITAIAGPSDEEIGQLVVVVETESEPVRGEDIERLVLGSSAYRGPPARALIAAPEAAPKPSPAAAAPAAPLPAAPSPAAPGIAAPVPFDSEVTQAVRVGMLRVTLPFRADGTTAPSPQRGSSADLALPQVLPFKPAAPATEPPAPASAPAAPEPSKTIETPLSSPPAKAPAPPESYPGHPAPPPIGAPLFSAAAPASQPAAAAEPPPLLGAPLFDATTPASAESPAAAPVGLAGLGANRLGVPPIELGPVTIERCATIAAAIAEQRDPRDEVLKTHRLTAEAWTAAEDHWAKAIAADAKSGSGKLLGAYDAAYVAAIESFRGPVTAEEYGRLLHAMKAGKVNEALAGLHIQRTAMTRLMRVWTKKLAEDPQLLRQVQGVTGAGSS